MSWWAHAVIGWSLTRPVCHARQILRVFDAPQVFLSVLKRAFQGTSHGGAELEDGVTRVDKAYVPELGLSNKVRPPCAFLPCSRLTHHVMHATPGRVVYGRGPARRAPTGRGRHGGRHS